MDCKQLALQIIIVEKQKLEEMIHNDSNQNYWKLWKHRKTVKCLTSISYSIVVSNSNLLFNCFRLLITYFCSFLSPPFFLCPLLINMFILPFFNNFSLFFGQSIWHKLSEAQLFFKRWDNLTITIYRFVNSLGISTYCFIGAI